MVSERLSQFPEPLVHPDRFNSQMDGPGKGGDKVLNLVDALAVNLNGLGQRYFMKVRTNVGVKTFSRQRRATGGYHG